MCECLRLSAQAEVEVVATGAASGAGAGGGGGYSARYCSMKGSKSTGVSAQRGGKRVSSALPRDAFAPFPLAASLASLPPQASPKALSRNRERREIKGLTLPLVILVQHLVRLDPLSLQPPRPSRSTPTSTSSSSLRAPRALVPSPPPPNSLRRPVARRRPPSTRRLEDGAHRRGRRRAFARTGGSR